MEDRLWLINEALVKEAREFIESAISLSREKVTVVYHGDGDGCCSAYFVSRFLKRLGVDTIAYRWVATPDFDFKCLERPLLTRKPNLAIFLDLPVHIRADFLRTLRRKTKILIYDHHSPPNFAGSNLPDRSKFLYINPVIHLDGSTPTTIFTWQLNGEEDILNREILFMGLYTESWVNGAPFFDDMDKKHKKELRQIAREIHSSFLVRNMNTIHYALNFLLGLKKPIIETEDLDQNREYQILKNMYRMIHNEKEWILYLLLQDMKKMPQPRYILRRIDSRMRLSGIIASDLRWRYPDLIVGIWQRWDDVYYCELRKGKDCPVNLLDIIDEIKKEAKLKTGGGHPEAVAFTANQYQFLKAMRKIKEIIKLGMKQNKGDEEKMDGDTEQ